MPGDYASWCCSYRYSLALAYIARIYKTLRYSASTPNTGRAVGVIVRGERLDSAQEGARARARDMTHVAGADTCFERPCTVAKGAAAAATMLFAKPTNS